MPKSNTSHLIVPNWPAPQHVQAITTTRKFSSKQPGFSLPPFEHFNLGTHVEDSRQAVENNRQLLSDSLQDKYPIQWLNQIHGSDVIELVEPCSGNVHKGDALVTRVKGQPLAILTADCLPVLLCDRQGTVIGAVHCGWRSLAQGILTKCCRLMGGDVGDIIAWLGPCIGSTAFEVGAEVRDVFVSKSALASKQFTPVSSKKYLANLQGLAQLELKQLGINQIFALAECTYLNESKYFSYRRQQTTGRMATLICLD
jgi:YfiH family protein